MKEDFSTFLSICLLLAFSSHFGNSTDEGQLKKCCDESSGNGTECHKYCHSYLAMMNGTDACVKHFNRIMKCNAGTVDRTRCCRAGSISNSAKCSEFCSNYDIWINNFTKNCGNERQAILFCFVETAVLDVPPTIINVVKSNVSHITTLECKARGKPNVTYNWKKDGVKLWPTDRDNGTLQISDEGYYQCSAKNQHGTALSDVTRVLKNSQSNQHPPAGAPSFNDITDGPYNMIVTEGCNATFRCSASADPKASIDWFRNGEIVNAENRQERFEFSDDNQNLTIVNVCQDCVGGTRKSDLMVIQCNASNQHGYDFRSGTLNVLRKTKVTTDNVTEVVAPVESYTNATVCCRAVSDAVVSLGTRLTWYRKTEDGRCSAVPDYQPPGNNQSGVTAFDNTLVIRIEANDTAAWKRDGGEYVCVGQHRGSRDEQVVAVNPNARVDLKLEMLTTTDERFQKRAVFICSFSYDKKREVKFLKFLWYQNNTKIANSIQQTISSISETADLTNSYRTINLTFPFIPLKYSENRVRCVAEYWAQMNFSIYRERSLPVVRVHPEVSITSSANDVTKSQSFTLTCTVTNFYQINATEVTFVWYRDHKEHSKTISNSSMSTKTLTLAEEKKTSVVFGCRATSRNLPSVIQNASITVLEEREKFCGANTDSEIAWPQTRMGGTAKRQCTNNRTGECTRDCSKNAEWRAVDCSRCVDPELTSILKDIKNFKYAIGNNNRSQVANVVKTLSDFTNDTHQPKGLKYGDLSGSVEAVSGLVQLQKKNEGQPPKKEEVVWAVQIITNLLNPENEKSWNSLRETNKSAAATLMALGDSYGEGLTQIINRTEDGTPVKEATNQVVLEAVKKKVDNFPQSFAFPSSNDIEWGESSDKISLNVHEENIETKTHDNSLNVWSLYYRNLNEFLPNESHYFLNSRVLSLSVAELPKNRTSLRDNVTVTLHHVSNITAEKRERKCAYWKFDSEDSRNGSWVIDDGCTVVASQSDENQTVCSCNHLTNFAILMSRDPKHHDALSIISKIGCAISIIALVLTIIIYAVTWKQAKSHQAAVLLNLCVALLIAYIVFLAGADKVNDEKACTAVAVLLHYFFLAAFFLMLAEGVQLFICVYFVFHVRQRRETAGLIIAGWVLPLIIVATSLGIKRTAGYGGEKMCWLSIDDGLLWAFAGPVFGIILINIVVIVAVLRKIVCSRVVSNKRKEQDNSKLRKMAWSVAVLCPVLGIAWLFGVLSIAFEWIGFQYIFTIANSFQGLFIFIFHGLYNNKKSNEKISSFVSEVISRTPFKRRQDITTTTASGSSTAAGKASLASKDLSQDSRAQPMESFSDTGGKEGNAYSFDFSSTAFLEPAPSEVSTPVHTDNTTTPL